MLMKQLNIASNIKFSNTQNPNYTKKFLLIFIVLTFNVKACIAIAYKFYSRG